jgi:xylulokinase
LADIFRVEIVTVNAAEGAAYGATPLAAAGAGAFDSVESACDATVQITSSTQPGTNRKIYEKIYLQYRPMYPLLKSTFVE